VPPPEATGSINPSLQDLAAPRRVSLPPPSSPPSRAPGTREGAWELIPEPGGSETTRRTGTLATGQGNTQGRQPAGFQSVAERREPPIYPRSFSTHPSKEAQDLVGIASTLLPPKLPHTHPHTQGHIRAALGPAHPLPLLGHT
jgi:hypothetical protein